MHKPHKVVKKMVDLGWKCMVNVWLKIQNLIFY